MKKITIFLLFIIVALKLQGQSTTDLYQNEIDTKLQNIDKTPITSNILLDRVISISSIVDFNQQNRQDTTHYQHFKQVWYELYNASYTKNFVTMEEVKDKLYNKNYTRNTIPIGIINTEFHYGDAGTQNNPNINFNSSTETFSNIAGKTPFKKLQTTIISPLVEEIVGPTVMFKTDTFFKLYKNGKAIKTLVLNTNGNSYNLINNYNFTNANHTTTYSTSGIKNLKFIATFSDNTTKTSYGKLYVYLPSTALGKSNSTPLIDIFADSDLYFQGYDETKSYQGKNEYRIYYNDNSSTLDKPIIIVDGFDPGDTRKIEKTDDGHDENSPSIVQLMSYDHDNNPITKNKDLIEELNDDGYDVIVVNHPSYPVFKGSITTRTKIDGGSDYVERNAYVLISLIRKLKLQQQGTEEMVIIGPSMGGLITRYALAYMEQQLALTNDNAKWNHNTRLWVSFDSPHQGANVPIGIQHWLHFHSFNSAAKENLEDKINSPAAKQMLVHHHLSGSETPQGAPNFRNVFQNKLNQLGMPNNLRKIALNNGSIMGSKVGVSGQEILNTHIEPGIISQLAISYFTAGLFQFNGIYSNIYFAPHANTTGKVFDGRVSVRTLFWNWNLYRERDYSSPGILGSYDSAPGSYTDTQNILYNESKISNDFVKLFVRVNRDLLFKEHSFIPTKSALAYTGSNVLDEVIGTKNRFCTGETPFDSYFAPEDNEEHIFLTTENVDWLKKELDNNKQQPTVYKNFDSSSISGDLAVCDNKTNTYTLDIPNSCSGFNVTWSSSNNIDILYSTNNSVTVRPINGTNDITGHISAYIQEKNLTLDKFVWVGIPSPNFLSISKIGSYEFYANQWTKLKVVHPVPPLELMSNDPTYGLSYQWSVPNSQIRTFADTSTIDVNPFNTGQLNVGVKMQNQCGCTEYKYQLFNVQRPTGSGSGSGGGAVLTPIGKN